MEAIWVELVIVLLLILANGFFAGAKLTIVSMSVDDPHSFLATVLWLEPLPPPSGAAAVIKLLCSRPRFGLSREPPIESQSPPWIKPDSRFLQWY